MELAVSTEIFSKRQKICAFMKKAQSWANDCYTGCFKAKYPNSYLWRRTLTGIRSTDDLRECYGLDIISPTHGDGVTFVKRRLGPPCFCHNEMVSCFEAVCITIASPALDFLQRQKFFPFYGRFSWRRRTL